MKEDIIPKPEDNPEKFNGVEAWLVSGHGRQKRVTIREVKCKFSTTDSYDDSEVIELTTIRFFTSQFVARVSTRLFDLILHIII
jgi:hypothetical protein